MLLELQRSFRRALLDAPDSHLATAIAGDGLAPEARLRIYRNHVALSLREALRSTFPVACRLVGDEFFAGLTRAYSSAHPPRSPCLFEYGETLPTFIAAYGPAQALPYLPDVAQLEWALNVAYNAPALAAIDPGALATLAPERLAGAAIVLQPSLVVLRSQVPVDEIWRANQPDRDGSGVDLGRGAVVLLVWRQADDAVFQQTDETFGAFVEDLAGRSALGPAFERACASAPGFDAGAALGRLLAQGLIAGIAPSPTACDG